RTPFLSTLAYLPEIRSIKWLNLPNRYVIGLRNRERSAFDSSLKSKALNAGVSVSDNTSDHKVAVAIVNANCRKNWPEIPSRNAVGMNTPASTSTIEIKAV